MQSLKRTSRNRFKRWLFDGVEEIEGPHEKEGHHQQHSWWKVMCLTGVDYFSTLGYQPGIAFIAAGALSPIATMILVLLTLFGALPIYSRVAKESPHGEGSIAMLEQLLSRWKGKLFVLVLLGFVATDFVITITLSAADATAHILENPFVQGQLHILEHPVWLTLVLIAVLGAVFLRGFHEAIGIAVILVAVYLFLNLIVVGVGWYELLTHPELLGNWKDALFNYRGADGNVFLLIGFALLVFPKLALGLSGFETGVAVMPLVKRENRIGNTRKLLATAALIMSFMLIASSFVTSVLIPPREFCPQMSCDDTSRIHELENLPACACGLEKGKANGRALAYIAHDKFGEIFSPTIGNVFGTIYDISTILILWFAGASAMAGLLNIVPRYLPRYGMAPEWARATRPLTAVFTVLCFGVTILFQADVDAQGGAYATGVLVLMSSAAVAVTISAWNRKSGWKWAFATISTVFVYTTITNIIERPDGIKIASFFIFAIIASSFISRALRSTEIRVDHIEFDEKATEFLNELKDEEIRIVTNRREKGDVAEYRFKEHEKRIDNHIPSTDPVVFYEIETGDASEFKGKLKIRGFDIDGYKVLRTQAPAVPNAIAALLMHLRDETGKIPHVYFGWSEGNPIMYLIRFVLFGEGDTAPVTREILRQAESDPELRPSVHVGG
ncbi:MAG: amino acid transporter [Acidobacteria bacterium]|nr:amino acid transporter [Acidobacteriota bacterium]